MRAILAELLQQDTGAELELGKMSPRENDTVMLHSSAYSHAAEMTTRAAAAAVTVVVATYREVE